MTVFQRMVLGARAKLAREVELCVLPNEERTRVFREQTKTDQPVECVWNVPRSAEICSPKKKPVSNSLLKLFYGGTLTSKILPKVLLESIVEMGSVELHIVGYATYSETKYFQWLRDFVRQKKNINLYGSLCRHKMLNVADLCDAAICLYSPKENQINFRYLAGASNKPFDAMARGLALVVSDLSQWTQMYLGEKNGYEVKDGKEYRISDVGYGIAINPESGGSVRAGLEWMLSNREKLWEMGERGRKKIQKEWNYEKMFTPVLKKFEIK